MKLSLINTGVHLYPPLGLAYIASYVKKYGGHEVEIIDFIKNQKQLNKAIKKSSPDFVGFTSVTSNYPIIIKLAEGLKSVTDVPFMVGGPHISTMPQSLSKVFGVGVIGEGEETVLNLMDRKKEIENIKGIVYRDEYGITINLPDSQIENIDTIPYPDRELLDMNYYLKKHDILNNHKLLRGTTILTSRGCPYNCVYCQASSVWGNARYHSSHYVFNEILHLIDNYNVEALNIIDDLCIANTKRLMEIVNLIENEGINKTVQYNINGRANLLTEDRFKLMKRMNIVQIAVGFESGSQKVLNYLKGGNVTIEDNENVFVLAKKYNISIGAQIMIGIPGERIIDLNQTLTFIKKHKAQLSHVNLNIATPLPGTVLWNDALKKGLVSEKMDFTRLTIAPSENIDDNLYIGDIPHSTFKEIYYEFTNEISKTNQVKFMDILKNYSIEDIVKTVTRNPKGTFEYLRGVISK